MSEIKFVEEDIRKMNNNGMHTNLTAYNEHEKYFDIGSIESYRASKLIDVQKNVSFVKNHFDNKINVLEIGSGNSKFLYALESCGMLNEGYGIEISKSRFDFANKWKEDLSSKRVININANVIDYDLTELPKFDLVYCVDLAFQFFDPIKQGSDVGILQKALTNLNENGKIILELDSHKRLLKNMEDGKAKIWQEFEEPDPWRYLLWDCYHEYDKQYLHLKKVFIKRDLSQTSENKVILKSYQKDEIKQLLIESGYVNICFYNNWQEKDKILDDEFIVIGVKKHA